MTWKPVHLSDIPGASIVQLGRLVTVEDVELFTEEGAESRHHRMNDARLLRQNFKLDQGESDSVGSWCACVLQAGTVQGLDRPTGTDVLCRGVKEKERLASLLHFIRASILIPLATSPRAPITIRRDHRDVR